MDDFMFPSTLRALVPGTQITLEFHRYSELARWLEAEAGAWSSIVDSSAPTPNPYGQARRALSSAAQAKDILERMKLVVDENERWNLDEPTLQQGLARLVKMFRDIENGDQLCLQSPGADRVLQIARTDKSAALLYATLHMRQASRELNAAAVSDSFSRVLRDLAVSAVPASADVDIENLKLVLRSARVEADEQLRQIEVRNDLLHDQQRELFDSNRYALDSLRNELAAEKDRCKDDLTTFRKYYSNSLALSAPTSYWAAKKKRHKVIAGLSALGFLVVCGLGLALLFCKGVPYLAQLSAGAKPATAVATASAAQAPTVTAASTTSPAPVAEKSAMFAFFGLSAVLAPAFVAIWILRILGRLLGTHLALMEDAEERVTMVTTFLAFSGSEHGEKIVSDSDRGLVLTALFRPSAVTASDDSPVATLSDVASKLKGGA